MIKREIDRDLITLPTYEDAKRRIEKYRPTKLDKFIVRFEPHKSQGEEVFREMLREVVLETIVNVLEYECGTDVEVS